MNNVPDCSGMSLFYDATIDGGTPGRCRLITLREYLEAIKSWLLPAGLVFGLLCAAAFTYATTPQYAATTTLFVSAQGLQNDASKAYQGNQLATERVKTYTELIMSDRIRTQVSNRLHIQIAPRQIFASAQPQTVLIATTVTDTSPYRAQQIANAVGVEFEALVAQLEQPSDNVGAPPTVTAKVVQPAQLPSSPTSPRPGWNLAVGGLLGLLLGYVIAFLRHVSTMSLMVEDKQHAIGSGVLGWRTVDSKSH